MRLRWTGIRVVLLLVGVLGCARGAWGYIEVPYTLGRVVSEATNILVIRIESVDKEKNLIVFRKERDLKGTHPNPVVKHNIGKGGFHPREWQTVMAWAEPGKVAVYLYSGGPGEVCIDNYWYQVYAGDWCVMSHAEPYLLRTYTGKPERLVPIVQSMLAGQEVVVPCMVDGNKEAIQLRTARVQRMKASLKLMDYNAARDFVGWGGVDDMRAIAGMGAFSHYGSVLSAGQGAMGIAAADYDLDKRVDFVLYGTGRAALLQNAGGAFNEQPLPAEGPVRGAAWADADGDGRPDLLLATLTGPKLLLSVKDAPFKDASAALPAGQAYWNLTAATWIDYDMDGRPDILLADGFHGLRLYRNRGAPATGPAPAQAKLFEDVSDVAGVGENGAGGRYKGDHLAVADVNGDGRPDVLYSAHTGVLLLNRPTGFVEASDSGLSYRTGRVAPVFGDYVGDRRQHLFVPQAGVGKLYRNDGQGRFTEVTPRSGALANPLGQATSAVWVDLQKPGRLDLVVGCVGGPNRYFRNNGDGTFTDATEEVGFYQRAFHTRALAAVDTNNDGTPDLLMHNEGMDSSLLLAKARK